MMIRVILLLLLFLLNCKMENINKHQKDTPFYVGTYTEKESKGIYKYVLHENGNLEYIGLSIKSTNPSYLAMSSDKKYLLAVNEIKDENGVGTVESYFINKDSLQLINSSSSGGAHPCFISINEKGFILTANYSGGNVGLLRLNEQGQLSALLDLQQHEGSGESDRQQSAHAHQARFIPKSNQIISVDLGTNELWFSHLDTTIQKIIPSDPQQLKMVPGAGPRHLSFHPNGKWIYVLNELESIVTLLTKNDLGMYEISESFKTLPSGFNEKNYGADIHVSSDGKFAYASNRGHNSIVIYKVNLENGFLDIISHESTQGEWPRNFTLSPDNDYLLVANQHSNNIVSFKRDFNNGGLQFISKANAPTPTCIVF